MAMAELKEYLDRVAERLYAGLYIYAAIAYLVWLPALSVFMLLLPLVAELPQPLAAIASFGYWSAAAVFLVGAVMRYYWRRYVARLAARAKASGTGWRRCQRSLLLWLATPMIIALSPTLAGGVLGVEQALALGLCLGLAVGNTGNTILDRCYGVKWPPPLIAVVTLIAGAPLVLTYVWGAFVALVVASYSATAIAYLTMAIARVE
jgi:hypothetical protein